MKTRIIAYSSIICLFLILASQIYVVYDYFILNKKSLEREIIAVLNDAYNEELNIRHKSLSPKKGETQYITPPPQTKNNTVVYNFDKMNVDKTDVLGLLNAMVNDFTSKKAPLNIHKLDSIIVSILKKRNIQSDFVVRIINPSTGKIIESSKKSFTESHFLIYSKYLPLDFENKKSLQLILLNPLSNIFRRMGVLLAGSFLLSIFCFYGLWFLFSTLARQKKLMEVKNDFFGNTAHELKRPVAQLHLALEALSKPEILDNTAKRERYLAISTEATRDMSEKITIIMTLSMAEEGVFKLNYSHFNLLEEVEKLKEQFSTVAGKEVEIKIEKTDEDFSINADRDHIRQCLANLLDNAIKYSGNSVLISITLQRWKDSLQVSVKDNGIGIIADKQDKVFEKYTRLNSEPGAPTGFGIGLSYVKAVMEKHAGKIELKSEAAVGSEFTMVIPI
jgi:signal transduction histidine kinase